MKDSAPDPRQTAILKAAWKAFAIYGYRKTSMDDIAREAGMSRPALYLHYRNKQDIFRSLARRHYDESTAAVAEALAGSGPVSEVLSAAFTAQGGAVIEAMLNSPHGMELLDASTTAAADIVQAGETRLQEIYADWLDTLAGERALTLPGTPMEMAITMTSALKGIKMAEPSYATYRYRTDLLARMIGAGLGD